MHKILKLPQFSFLWGNIFSKDMSMHAFRIPNTCKNFFVSWHPSIIAPRTPSLDRICNVKHFAIPILRNCFDLARWLVQFQGMMFNTKKIYNIEWVLEYSELDDIWFYVVIFFFFLLTLHARLPGKYCWLFLNVDVVALSNQKRMRATFNIEIKCENKWVQSTLIWNKISLRNWPCVKFIQSKQIESNQKVIFSE